MQNTSISLSVKTIILFYVTSVLTYVTLRAINLSFTYDEITSYNIMSRFNWYIITDTANNHFLNTFFMKLANYLFGDSEFSFRLPNIIACFFYLVFSLKIANYLNQWNKLSLIILLTANPFLIDFFSLARGYGLSLMFMIVSIYYLILFFDNLQFLNGLLSLFFGIFGMMSNLTIINYFLPLTFSLVLIIIINVHDRKEIYKTIGLVILIAGISTYIMAALSFKLKNNDELFFGGRIGFFYDVIVSNSRCFKYNKQYNIISIIYGTVFLYSIFIAFINIVINREVKKISFIISLIFFLSILSPIVQNLIFKTNFPVERASLFYYPLMILVLFFGSNSHIKQFNNFIIIGVSILFFTHFVLTLNIDSCYSWKFDSSSKKVMNKLKEETKTKKGNVKLGINSIYYPSINFYYNKFEMYDFEIHNITQLWEYDLNKEELNPYYYGTGKYSKKELSFKDVIRFKSLNMDYYYVDKFFVNELTRLKLDIEIIEEYSVSDSFLIKFN